LKQPFITRFMASLPSLGEVGEQRSAVSNQQ